MSNKPEPHILEHLIEVMRALRDPENGCPWDVEQDFSSIAPYTIEEAYEVADAIERGNMEDLCEEVGDLLFQSIYHAQMAAERGAFDIYDVIENVIEKMVSRHPHVFGDAKATSSADVDKIWDERKAAEKKDKSDKSVLDGVTKALPALLRAEKLQHKAANVGFEWDSPEDALDKLQEEIAEMREALRHGTEEEKAEELGDLLFALTNFGRMTGISAETALRAGNNKFERRFKGIEADCKGKGLNINQATLEQLKQLWHEQKEKE